MGIVLSIFGAYSLGAKIKVLWKLVAVINGKFFYVKKIEGPCFYLKFFYVHSTLLANKRVSLDSKQKTGQK